MKKFILMTAIIASIAFLVTGCSQNSGTPPVLSVDGIDITIGESRPYDLTSQGFETTLPGNYMAIGELPAKSWLSSLLITSKEDHNYVHLYIYNPNKETKLYGLATIYRATFKMHSEENSYWAENNNLVNGINFFGMDSASVKEQMKDYKLGNETDSGILRYDDGNYHYSFFFDQETGILDEIDVDMDVAKSYDEAK